MIPGHPAHRFSMTKGIVASLGVTATVLACLAAGTPAAQATSGAQEHGTDAAFGKWDWSHFTERQTDPNPPVDADGETGENNLANVSQIGEPYDEWVPGTSETEYSAWVTEKPKGERWDTYDVRTVTDKKAWHEQVLVTRAVPAVPGKWTNFRPNDIHAPFDGPPSYPLDPRGSWSDPKIEGGPQEDASGVYQNGNGHGSWFYRSKGTPAIPAVYETVEHEAVTHEELMFVRTVTSPGHYEYYWSVYARTNTPGETPGDGSGETPVSNEPGGPNEPSVSRGGNGSTATAELNSPNHLNVTAEPSRAIRPHRSGVNTPVVPLSIDAGL